MNQTWTKLSFGTLKVNCDVAWSEKKMKRAARWIIRDFARLLTFAGGTDNL